MPPIFRIYMLKGCPQWLIFYSEGLMFNETSHKHVAIHKGYAEAKSIFLLP